LDFLSKGKISSPGQARSAAMQSMLTCDDLKMRAISQAVCSAPLVSLRISVCTPPTAGGSD